MTDKEHQELLEHCKLAAERRKRYSGNKVIIKEGELIRKNLDNQIVTKKLSQNLDDLIHKDGRITLMEIAEKLRGLRTFSNTTNTPVITAIQLPQNKGG